MEHSEELIKFCETRLEEILKTEISKEIAEYILSIEDKNDLKDFISNFAGELVNVMEVNQFVIDLMQKRLLLNRKKEVAYKKKPETNYVEPKGNGKQKKANQTSQNSAHPQNQLDLKENETRKKAHFVPLYNQQGAMKDMPMLPGRHSCNCEATQHELVNNCIECGRIVCQQEGSGPCLTCGALVCSPDEQEILNRGSKKSAKLHEKLMNLPKPEEESQLAKAIAHKNKLLEFNESSAQRTKIVDDDIDYYSIEKINENKWLTQDQKKQLLKKAQTLQRKKEATKGNRVIGIDFLSHKIIDGESISFDSEVDELKRLADNFSSLQGLSNEITDFKINPMIAEAPQYDSNNTNNVKLYVPSLNPGNSSNKWHQPIRLQDKELQEVQDNGMCLSMHQPWASMLVMGIKKHEGRTWYTHHRGCLWIHSAAKLPSASEVVQIEDMHRQIKGNENVIFPEQYPVSCLLGCVIVTDCIEQEEYRRVYPDGESASPYVLICENPMELLIKFPMKGKHKIFQLDPQIHQAAKKTLRKYVATH